MNIVLLPLAPSVPDHTEEIFAFVEECYDHGLRFYQIIRAAKAELPEEVLKSFFKLTVPEFYEILLAVSGEEPGEL